MTDNGNDELREATGEGAAGAHRETQRRRIVLHPRTAATRGHDRARSFGGHVRGYTVDTDAVLELVDRQRRASIRYVATILVPLSTFAFALHFVPEIGRIRPFGLVALPWLVLGPGALFTLVGLAFLHERSALRIEDEWAARHDTPRSDRPST